MLNFEAVVLLSDRSFPTWQLRHPHQWGIPHRLRTTVLKQPHERFVPLTNSPRYRCITAGLLLTTWFSWISSQCLSVPANLFPATTLTLPRTSAVIAWLESMTRLESRSSQNGSTRVTVNDSRLESESFLHNLSFWRTNPSRLRTKKWASFASVMIKIGGNFPFCLSSRAMLHFKDQVSPTCMEEDPRPCLHWGASRAQYIDNLSWFNVVFAYRDHGSGSHTVNLRLFLIPVNWFKFFRFKSKPKTILRNIMQMRKPNLVWILIPATVVSLSHRFSNFLMLQHTNTFWIWLRHAYLMESKTYFSQTLQRELLISFFQNTKLSRHTSRHTPLQRHAFWETLAWTHVATWLRHM